MRGDDDVNFLPTGGRRAEALGGVDGGREERLGAARDELAESIMAAVAVPAGAAGEMVEEVGGELVEVVAAGDGVGGWVMRATGVAAERWGRAGKGKRDAEAMADEELCLDVGEGGGGRDVITSEEQVGERCGGVADAGAGGKGEAGGGGEGNG